MCKIKSDTEFDGYAGKKELTSSKIMTDVFKKGDRYFNSGDLLTVDKDYFVYFSDRIGDTFRCVFPPLPCFIRSVQANHNFHACDVVF